MFLPKATSNFIFLLERQPTRGMLPAPNTPPLLTEEAGFYIFCLPDNPEFIAEATSIISQAHLDTTPAEIEYLTKSKPLPQHQKYSMYLHAVSFPLLPVFKGASSTYSFISVCQRSKQQHCAQA